MRFQGHPPRGHAPKSGGALVSPPRLERSRQSAADQGDVSILFSRPRQALEPGGERARRSPVRVPAIRRSLAKCLVFLCVPAAARRRAVEKRGWGLVERAAL